MKVIVLDAEIFQVFFEAISAYCPREFGLKYLDCVEVGTDCDRCWNETLGPIEFEER